MVTKYPLVRVFITKSQKFRAAIQEEGEPPYEVSINGRNWSLGVGRKHEQRIVARIETMTVRLNMEASKAGYLAKARKQGIDVLKYLDMRIEELKNSADAGMYARVTELREFREKIKEGYNI